MSNNWPYNIKHVVPGEPVQAGIVNRPDRALENRTDYLRERLDAAELGRAVFDNEASIAADVVPGDPVYWNYTSHRYERALAAVEVDAETQAFVMLPSSECVGLCTRKRSGTVGDICLRGIVNLPEIANAVVGPLTPGHYYLSSATPGKLTKQRPAVTVSVCYVQTVPDACNSVPRVVVMPSARELLDEHTHYRFELYARPAGTNTLTDGVRSVESPNPELEGWLPANHLTFNGKAPEGAVFGYNLSQHTALSRVWPPLPIQSVAMLWDKGEDLVGATEIPLGRNGLAICDANGIWWMSNCDGDQPWPSSYSTVPVEDTDPPVAECPRDETMRIVVAYIRMLVGNDRRVVTKLEPALDSPIVVTNCDGLPATTGDLELNLNLQYATPDGDGALVVKETVSGRKLRRGYVTEGIFYGPSNDPLAPNYGLSISGDADRELTADEKVDLGLSPTASAVLHRGFLRLEFEPDATARELLPQIVRLNDTVERLYRDIPYLGFPAGQASSMRMRFNVPYLAGTGLQMQVRVQFFGKGSSQMPALTMTRMILKKPPAATNLTDTPEAGVNFNSLVTIDANTAVERDSEPFAVDPGDTVLVTIARPGTDVYPEIGILRVTGILSKV